MRKISLRQNEFIDLSSRILSNGGAFSFKAHGLSMHPFIRHGDVITVHPFRTCDLRLGDIACYNSAGGRLVVHRIVKKKAWNNQLVLKLRGDAAPDSVEWIKSDQVMGRIVGVRRGDKNIPLCGGYRRLIALLWITFFPLSYFVVRKFGAIKKSVPTLGI